LQQDGIWRLRQSALLELGSKKVPLEGFLRLNLQTREARLVAMNEMGLVLFDLQVTEQEEQLHQAVPQLQRVKGFAKGVAKSLRQIFLLPRPMPGDKLQNRGNSQRLWRLQPDGSLGFIYDCQGDLRESRMVSLEENWRVGYNNYRNFSGERLPEQIVLNDYQHALKLTLWIHEMRRET
jgi:hypothetical protein